MQNCFSKNNMNKIHMVEVERALDMINDGSAFAWCIGAGYRMFGEWLRQCNACYHGIGSSIYVFQE